MVPVIVCTHGNSALELVESAEMICGKQDNCKTVQFSMGENLGDLKSELSEKIKFFDGKVICMTDLVGGTPFNTLVMLKKKYPNLDIVSGVNIPMLLQLFVYRSQLEKEELVKTVITAGKKSIEKYEFKSVIEDDF